jgi:hypothetical protein
MTSEEAAARLDAPVDMLFLDGDHTYEGVSADLRVWLPKLKAHAWLVLHDSGWAEGVQRAIRETVDPIQVTKPVIFPNLYAVQVVDHDSKFEEEK